MARMSASLDVIAAVADRSSGRSTTVPARAVCACAVVVTPDERTAQATAATAMDVNRDFMISPNWFRQL
jgi:hypothetical protein